MPSKKPMHPARKTFKAFLYACLALSILFMSSVIYLRMNYHYLRDNPELRNTIFRADIMMHKARTYWANDEEDTQIALSLINKGFFSALYSRAGLDMLRDQADDGAPPSQTKHADLIIAYRMGANPEQRAMYYYQMAAAQNYPPAIEKLSVLHSQNSR